MPDIKLTELQEPDGFRLIYFRLDAKKGDCNTLHAINSGGNRNKMAGDPGGGFRDTPAYMQNSVFPANKGFHCSIFGHSKGRKLVGGIGIAVFSTLPKLASVRALEWNHVFLTLVNENSMALL